MRKPILLAALLLATFFGNALHAAIDASLQMQAGNPSSATTDSTNHAHFLSSRAQFAMDYNDTNREPNWVAWDLTSGDVGSSGRSAFIVDTILPAGFYQVLTTDYSGSGYDRGHMCPSADRTVTTADNQQVFVMSNMVPQTPDNNQGVWASFETYCRSLAAAGNEILIISGPSGFAGSTIASGVAIPGYTWKIAVVVPSGAGTALSRITSTTRVIAIKIPNIAGVRNNPWQQYITSAAQIESDTGYTFFTALSASVANALRTQVDGQTSTGAPSITTQPTAQSVPVGSNATFSVAATSTTDTAFTYQWLKDDVEIAGATSATLTLTNVQAADAANYTVIVTNSVGSVTSAAAALVITGLPPSIATQPSPRTSAAGSTATFAVSASGSPTLTYQWRKGGVNLVNGGNVSGATLPNLTLTNVQSSDAANYDVVVTNSVSSATSNAVALTVTPAAPTITTQPTAQTVATGSTATLTVVATGTAPLSYQWRKGGVNLANGGNISGATSATLALANTVTGDSGSYDVVVSNGVNPDATSNAVTLTVSAASASSTIYWDFTAATPTSGLPSDVTGGTVTQNNNNGTTTLLTTTSASSGYTGVSGTSNAGAAARTGALNTAASGSAYFEFTLTPASGKQLVATALSFGSRSTSTGPQAYDVYTSADNFTTKVATGTFPNTSTWTLYTPTFTTVTGSTGTAITFRIYGYNGTGTASANTANWRIDDLKLTVNTVAASPTVPAVASTTPANNAANVAVNSAISVTFNQAVNVANGWFTITSAAAGPIAATVTGGPTTFTLTPPASFANGDTITVKLVAAQITDQATGTLKPASDTTFSFTTITPVAPSITTQPTPQTVAATGTAAFTVAATGTAPLSYQWRKGGVAITGNGSATTPTLTLTSVQSGDAANYDVVVTNSVSSVTSNAVALTVTPVAPTITTQPAAQFAVAGGNATFTVVVTGSTPFTYQWRKGGVNLANGGVVSGATTATLTLTGVTSADAASYDVVVSNGTAPTATSNAATLTINPAPTATIYWDFTAATPTSGLPSDVTGGTVTQNNNNGTTTLLTSTSASGSYTGASAGNNAGAAARIGALNAGASGSAYFEFTLTPVTGKHLQVSTLSFGSRSTSTGPQAFSIFTSQDNFSAPLATGTFANDSVWRLLAPGFAAFTTSPSTGVTFRIFGHNGTGSPGTGTANWRIDDLKVGVTTISASPVITTQPQAQAVTAGGNATFTVAATSTSTLTYQWRKNGAAITGNSSATTATLTLTNLNVADSATIDCVLTNSFAPVTSSAVALTVNPIPVTITVATVRTAYDGTPKSVTVTASPAVRLDINYGVPGLPTDVGTYLVVASPTSANYSGSGAGVLTIVKADQTISFGATPANIAVGTPFAVAATSSSGLPVTLAVASGNATLSGSSLTINDATTVVLRATQAGNSNYNSVSSDLTLSANKSAQTIAFAALSDQLSTAQPFALSAIASSGLPVTFTVVSGPASVSDSTLTLTGAAGTVVVRASQAGNAAFNPAPDVDRSFAVTLPLAAPVITQQPLPQTTFATDATRIGNASFTVVATGNPTPTYQWRKDGAPIPGATGATLAIRGAVASDAGGYDVVVTNPLGSVTSSLARLTVTTTATAPVIIRQPGSITALVGRSATFTVVATSAATLTYQWFKDGAALAGATGDTLTLASITAAQAGSYSVVVTNSAGSVTSAGAVLKVLAHSFAGYYFGTIAAVPGFTNGGAFALLVRDDNTGVLLGYEKIIGFLSDLPAGGYIDHTRTYIGRDVAVADDGSFTIGATAYFPNNISRGGAVVVPPPPNNTAPAGGLATASVTVTGTISSAGALSGRGGFASAAFTAARAADAGISAAFAGYYTAGAAGTASQLFVIVSPGGSAFVVALTNTTASANAGSASGAIDSHAVAEFAQEPRQYAIDSGVATVDANGRIVLTTLDTQTFTADISAANSSFTASLTDAKGVATSFSGFNTAAAAVASQRLVNLSTRASAGVGNEAAIVGFVLTGLESKTVLIRAVGPTLKNFGVTTALAAPRLDLIRGNTPIATNTGWSTAGNVAEITAAAVRAGAFALTAGSADSVILTTLAPGTYSAVVTPNDGRAGVGLVEVYDLSGGSAAQRLANLSTRASAGVGENTLIAGVVVTGSVPKRLLIRAAGPALTQFGVTGALARPQLAIYSSNNTVVAQNSGWSTSPDTAAIADGAARAGAFAFAAGSADAAVIVNLAPGAYTAQATGVGGTTGVALVEVYELP